MARRQRVWRPQERLLDVAEAYVIALRAALQCVLYPHDGQPRFTECRRLQGELWVLISRIELLYGPGSSVAVHAAEATGALAAVEVLARRDAHTEGDPSLRHRIEAEEASVEREYRAFLRAVRTVMRAGGRCPAGTGIRARLRAIRSSAPGPERRRDRGPRDEPAPHDEFLRDLDEFLRDVEERQPITDEDAAREDRDAGRPPAR